ncbi:MAG: AraC family transcriptional regulator [bacterium]|nr:AraC family transcriptional regulator [bacterium]
MIIFLFITGQRHPEFVQWFSKEIKKNRYERSLIKGLNTDDIKRRIEDLMEDEKLFCDEDLTLNRLAEILSLTPHQVSEFLNNVLRTNFSSFINGYRIDEAKRLLVDDPERSVLSVAYAVGFNSKSVFYNAFTRITGTSPSKFRNKKS